MTRPVKTRTLVIILGAWALALIPTWLSVNSAGGFDRSHWLSSLVMWISFATMALLIALVTRLKLSRGPRHLTGKWACLTRVERATLWTLGIATVVLVALMIVGQRHSHEPGYWARMSLFSCALCNATMTFLFVMARRSRDAETDGRITFPTGEARGLALLTAERRIDTSIPSPREIQGGHA